jgi:ABC-type uncharacterized transport system substrate-binding protein
VTTRRTFINLLGGAAASWPFGSVAQQPAMPVIGFLSSGSSNAYEQYAVGFRQGLKESGYVEGQNVAIEYRWGNGHYDLLPALAADLVRRQVAVIVASGGPPPALAARAATFTIPIVFSSVDEPIKLGLVASLNRPGGNATGMSLFRKELVSKQLELLRDMVPKAEVVAVLVNPANRQSDGYIGDIREAILVLQRQLKILNASTEAEINASFPAVVEQGGGALIITADTLFNNQRDQLAALATRYLLPTVSQFREFAAAGGLMSYGTNVADVYHQVGVYTGRILNGDRPADLPVMRPTKFDVVINLKTAKALGITVPPSLLARADEVIE